MVIMSMVFSFALPAACSHFCIRRLRNKALRTKMVSWCIRNREKDNLRSNGIQGLEYE